MKRWLEPLAQVAFVLAIALVALSIRPAPRPAQPTGPAPSEVGSPTSALATTSSTASAGPPWRPTPAGPSTPSLSGDSTPEPTPTARSGVGSPARFFRGQATYWDSLGPGWYVAVRRDLGIRVGSVIWVCDAKAQRCRAAPVVTTCACLGPHSDRIVDLSRDLFAMFADPSLGVTQVVLEVVP